MGYSSSYGFLSAAALCWLTMSSPAAARPVSYPDGWMLMLMNDHMENSAMLSYSPTAKDSIGLRSDYRRDGKSWMHTVTYNRLLQRWNAENSQGNLFVQTGAGLAVRRDRQAHAASLGLEADWETRQIYFSYENRYIYAGAIERSFSHKARAGFAPYVAGYDGIHTWLMVQVEHHPSGRDKFVTTPFIRVFTKDVLGEIGISSRADMMFNLTLQF